MLIAAFASQRGFLVRNSASGDGGGYVPEAWRTLFGGGVLPPGWTFETNANASNATLANDDGAVVTIPAGTVSDSISGSSDPDNTAGIVKAIDGSGNFDIAIRFSTYFQGDYSTQVNFLLRGASDEELLRWCFYATSSAAFVYAYQRSGGSGGAISVSLVFEYLRGHSHWMRIAKSGGTYTLMSSVDGVNWITHGSGASSLVPQYVKIAVGQYSDALGYPVRFDEFIDVAAAGTTDLRRSLSEPTIGTTETTDFTTLPAWLSLAAQVDGSATHSAGKASLATAVADGSRATLTYNGIGYNDAGMLVSFQLPTPDGDAYAAIGLAVDDGGSQIDQYADTPAYINEIQLSEVSFTHKAVVVRRPHGTPTDFNETYCFISAGYPTGFNSSQTCHFRIEKFGVRLRMRYWYDSDPEPSVWDLYEGDIDVLRGQGELKPYISVSHNDGAAADAVLDVTSLSFYEVS